MKIAYLGQMADVSGETSIAKKIRGQCVAWLDAGHEVRYFSLVPSGSVWSGMAPVSVDLLVRGGLLQRMARSFRLAKRIEEWRPDVIYFRYAYHSPGLVRLFQEIPTVAEINSDDAAEYSLTLSPAKVAFHRLTRKRLLRTMSGFVAVTNELAERFAGFGKPIRVIANGIPLADFRTLPPADPASLRLVFMGSRGSPWHGLHRVAELARMIPGAIVDVIGISAVDAPPEARSTAMCYHGALPRERYEPLLAAATAAIGTMGLYVKGMREACPLKVREYLAAGLPVIAAYHDTDVAADAAYFLQLPNSAASLESHGDRIRAFVESWRGRRVPRSAIAHLDSAGKEARRLEFIRELGGARA